LKKIIDKYYFELCDIIHPGASSVFIFCHAKNHELQIDVNQDRKIISSILEKYGNVLFSLFEYAFNPALITLGILNYFNLPELHTKELLNIDLELIHIWKDIQQNLKNAQIQIK